MQNIAAAAEILAESDLSTRWDDIVTMLDSENISERLRLAAHIIFRAKLVLNEIDKDPITKDDCLQHYVDDGCSRSVESKRLYRRKIFN